MSQKEKGPGGQAGGPQDKFAPLITKTQNRRKQKSCSTIRRRPKSVSTRTLPHHRANG